MEILIISGLSGAGKSRAASFLEDMGFYIVDNMPAAMILKFAEFCAGGSQRYDKVALVYDVRTANSPTELFDVLDVLKHSSGACSLLFLEAEPETIIKRYKETRRRHPLMQQADSLEKAVRTEQEMMEPLRQRADVVIDTTHLSTAQLRGELLRHFGSDTTEKGGMSVTSPPLASNTACRWRLIWCSTCAVCRTLFTSRSCGKRLVWISQWRIMCFLSARPMILWKSSGTC